MADEIKKLQQIIKERVDNMFQFNILYTLLSIFALGIFVTLFVGLDEVVDCDDNTIIKKNAKNGHKNTLIVGIVVSVIAFLISIFIFYYLFNLSPTTST